MQFLDRPRYPLPRRLLVAAQSLANGMEVTLLEEPQQDGGAILCPEFLNRVVQERSQRCQVSLRMIFHGTYFHRLPFALLTAAFAAHERPGGVARIPVQPATQHHLPRQPMGLAGQVEEHGLAHILRELRVPADQPQRR